MNGMVDGHRRHFLLHWRKCVCESRRKTNRAGNSSIYILYVYGDRWTQRASRLQTHTPHAKYEESFYFENLSPKSNLFRTLVCLLIFFHLLVKLLFFDIRFLFCSFACFLFISSTDNVITCSINNYMAEIQAKEDRLREGARAKVRQKCDPWKIYLFSEFAAAYYF